MHAVIRTGGKQYIVKPGDIIDIEKIPGDKGESVNFEEVLLFSDDFFCMPTAKQYHRFCQQCRYWISASRNQLFPRDLFW